MLLKWLPASILVMGALYIFFIPEDPLPIKILFKVIPMLLILLYASLIKGPVLTRSSGLILIGLFFCMLGDALLIWFVIGLSAFLIGHLFYLASFLGEWRFNWIRFLTILPIAAFSIWMGSRLLNSLSESGNTDLAIPVLCYISVISLMCWSSFMTGDGSAIIGACLFVLSDSILSWNKFITEVPYSGTAIMVTYYLAQFFIARSIRDQPGFTMRKNTSISVLKLR